MKVDELYILMLYFIPSPQMSILFQQPEWHHTVRRTIYELFNSCIDRFHPGFGSIVSNFNPTHAIYLLHKNPTLDCIISITLCMQSESPAPSAP